MSDLALVTPDAATTQEAQSWPGRARLVVIRDSDSYLAAGDYLKRIRELRQKIADTLDPHIKRAHETHKGLLAEKARADAPLLEAEGILKTTLQRYDDEQEKVRQAEEARLLALARADEEARRLAAAAALEAEAQATGDASLLADAQRVLETVQPVSVLVLPTTPKLPGVSYRDHWTARITNWPALIRYVAREPAYQHLLKPNQTALDGLARAMKGELRIDGVEAINTPTVAVSNR